MEWQRSVSFILLYGICIWLLISRINLLFFIDNGVIFGDVTFHYFPAGQTILQGGNPYDSPFITYPPLMLLLFAFLVLIWPQPYTIGFFLMGMYLVIPLLSYYLGRKYMSEGCALLFSWFVTLNPLTIYAFITLIDDDPLIMISLMAICYYYPEHPYRTSLLAGLFGAMKFFPLLAGIVIVLSFRQQSRQFRVKQLMLQISIFGLFMLIGFVMWGPISLTRLIHYQEFIGLGGPAMNPYHVAYRLGFSLDKALLTIIGLAISGTMIVVTILFWMFKSRIGTNSIPQLLIILCFGLYIANTTTSYLYYTWILPFLVIQVVVLIQHQRYSLFLVSSVGVFTFGYLAAEWANFTWAMGPEYVVWAHIGSIFVWVFISFLAILSLRFKPALISSFDNQGYNKDLSHCGIVAHANSAGYNPHENE
ncbi:MAG: hypothetical protein RTV31_02000 [Candidatus Thorarchaeota archaeon]